jgi:hypothetical protein
MKRGALWRVFRCHETPQEDPVSQLYQLACPADNFAGPACACLPCRFGNVPSGSVHERVYETDMTDVEWGEVRGVIPVPPWMDGRGGRPEEYCHRRMLDQCHEVKSPAAVSSVAGVRRGASAIQGIDQDLPEKAEAQWISLSRAEPMTCSRLVISVS